MKNLEVIISFSGFLAFYFLVIFNGIDIEKCSSIYCAIERAVLLLTVDSWLFVFICCVFMYTQNRYNKWLSLLKYVLLYSGVVSSLILINMDAWNLPDKNEQYVHWFSQTISATLISFTTISVLFFMVYDMITKEDWEEEQKRMWVIKGRPELIIRAEDDEGVPFEELPREEGMVQIVVSGSTEDFKSEV